MRSVKCPNSSIYRWDFKLQTEHQHLKGAAHYDARYTVSKFEKKRR